MLPVIVTGLLLATPAPAAPPPTAPTETQAAARSAVRSMQAFYEKLTDCSVSFTQTYVNEAFKKTLQSSGTLRFKKPGMLRFDYSAPEAKSFVVKNDRITSYVPAAQQAMVGSFKADQLSASVTFLFGKGNLESEFTVHPADRADLAAGTALLLLPKRDDPRFQKLYFVVDPQTSSVRESVVVDPSGNENRFDFKNIKANTGLSEKDFDDSLPKGTQIVKLGG